MLSFFSWRMCYKETKSSIIGICYLFAVRRCVVGNKSLVIQICYPCVVLTLHRYHLMQVVGEIIKLYTCHMMDSHAFLQILSRTR